MRAPSLPDDPTRDRPIAVSDHLDELRRRLGVSLAALLVAVGISATQAGRLVEWLRRPAGEALPRFAFFSPTEPLVAYLKVAALSGIALAMPVILWQAWAFVRAGLTRQERWRGVVLIWWGSVSFLAGLAFAYGVLLPLSLRVLLGLGAGQFEPVISVDRYLAFATTLLFWCGCLCELPVVLWILAVAGVVTPEWLRQQRPYAVLALVVVAALVTPTTDAVTLGLVALPLLLLYELSIIVTRLAMRRPP